MEINEIIQQMKATKGTRHAFRLPMTEDEALKLLTAAYITEVETRHRTFVVNAETSAVVQRVAHLMTCNGRTAILLSGGVGNGKTTMLYAVRTAIQFANVSLHAFSPAMYMKVADAKELCSLATTDKDEYTKLVNTPLLAIDDLGKEPAEVKEYGNIMSPIVDLFEKRYDKQLWTMATTNLTAANIRAHYGDRIADRLNEMMTPIFFRNKSFRN